MYTWGTTIISWLLALLAESFYKLIDLEQAGYDAGNSNCQGNPKIQFSIHYSIKQFFSAYNLIRHNLG